MLALDEAIDQARSEAKRLEDSVKARGSLIRLERAADVTPGAGVPTLTREPSVSGKDLESAPSELAAASRRGEPVFGHVAEEPSATAKAPGTAQEAEVAPITAAGGADLNVVQDIEEASQTAPAADESTFAGPIRDPKKPRESSPLTMVDADVEAAFDKFFSAEVEPDPAQQWLLSD